MALDRTNILQSSPLEGEQTSASTRSERRVSRGGYSRLTLGHARAMRKQMQNADFFCSEKRVVVELDGSQHQLQQSHGAKRTAFLESEGDFVMRFSNNDVFAGMDFALEKIYDFLNSPHASDFACGSSSAAPPQGGS